MLRHAVRSASKIGKQAARNQEPPTSKNWRYSPKWATIQRIFTGTFARQLRIPAPDRHSDNDELRMCEDDRELLKKLENGELPDFDFIKCITNLEIRSVSLRTASGSLSVVFEDLKLPLMMICTPTKLSDTEHSCCARSESDDDLTEDEVDQADRLRRLEKMTQ